MASWHFILQACSHHPWSHEMFTLNLVSVGDQIQRKHLLLPMIKQYYKQ